MITFAGGSAASCGRPSSKDAGACSSGVITWYSIVGGGFGSLVLPFWTAAEYVILIECSPPLFFHLVRSSKIARKEYQQEVKKFASVP